MTLKYTMFGVPNDDASNNGTGTPPVFRELVQVRQLAVERNVIELALPSQATQDASKGCSADGALTLKVGTAVPDIFRRFIAKENIIRHVNDVPSAKTSGIFVSSCTRGVVQGNIFDLACGDEALALNDRAGTIGYFNNQRASGAPVTAFESVVQRDADELRTRIEDALCAALL